jgi:hypothetical protein
MLQWLAQFLTAPIVSSTLRIVRQARRVDHAKEEGKRAS